MTYQHLRVEEREEIQAGLWRKESIRSIAERLGRSPASISREITKNQALKKRYFPRLAHERALLKRKERGRKLRLKNQTIRRHVIKYLKKGYSPEQIAGSMYREIGETISHEAIYQYIYAQVHRGEAPSPPRTVPRIKPHAAKKKSVSGRTVIPPVYGLFAGHIGWQAENA